MRRIHVYINNILSLHILLSSFRNIKETLTQIFICFSQVNPLQKMRKYNKTNAIKNGSFTSIASQMFLWSRVASSSLHYFWPVSLNLVLNYQECSSILFHSFWEKKYFIQKMSIPENVGVISQEYVQMVESFENFNLNWMYVFTLVIDFIKCFTFCLFIEKYTMAEKLWRARTSARAHARTHIAVKSPKPSNSGLGGGIFYRRARGNSRAPKIFLPSYLS